jgi:hypothetical protein
VFGNDSAEAKKKNRSDTEWKRTLRKVLSELDRYLATNIVTDDWHLLMLHEALAGADMSLQSEDFWPAYAEGITRMALILMGDYPDHRNYKGGGNKENHYRLSQERSVHYTQTPSQKLRTLLDAHAAGLLKAPPMDVLRTFRNQFGSKPGYDKFLKWYRKNYPEDYTAVF